MAEIAMRRDGNRLVPVDQVSEEMLAEIPSNKDVMVTVKVPRSLRQFRLAWCLADIVAKSCDWLHDREDGMNWLKIRARHVRMIHDPLRGTTAIVPKSIAFASVDPVQFARILNRMIHVTITEIIPGMEESILRAELEAIAGIDTAPPQAAPKPKPSPKAAAPQKTPDEPLKAKPDPLPPQNEVEYIRAFRGWLAKQDSRDAALDHFDGKTHADLRTACNVSQGSYKMMRREILMKYEPGA